MAWLYELRLIRAFELYLALVFLLSTFLRIRQYYSIVKLARSLPARWPRLMKIVNQYKHIFLTWGTVLPLAISLGLLLVHMMATRLIWPSASLTMAEVLQVWPSWPVLLVTGLAMIVFDLWGAFWVGEFDMVETEKYFDQAEYWLRSWTAPVVKIFTLGYVNPRKMVAAEVRSALVNVSEMINFTLWWLAIQAGFRILFGLSLWITWALYPWLLRLVS